MRSYRLFVVAALTVALLLALGACTRRTETTTTPTATAATPSPSPAPVEVTHAIQVASYQQMSKAQIETMQRELNAVGCFVGTVDGVVGPHTVAGLEEFQRAEGLTVDGVYGPQTAAKLNQAAAGNKKVCSAAPTPAPHDPPCDFPQIEKAVAANRPSELVFYYGCESGYAFALAHKVTPSPTATGGSPSPSPTALPIDRFLLRASNNAWVIETCPTTRGNIPSDIFNKACGIG